jgi:hypothetical protein
LPSSAEVQGGLVDAILSAKSHRPYLSPTKGPLSPAALGVRHNGVCGALANALRLTYPTVNRLVGNAFFDRAATTYVAESLSNTRIDLYGIGFPCFLAGYPPAQGLAYLADAARLDQAIDRAVFGADDSVRLSFPLDRYVALSLPANLAILHIDHPVDEIREALDTEDDDGLAHIDVTPGRRCLAVWRSKSQPRIVSLDPAASHFLAVIIGGGGVRNALAAAIATANETRALIAIKKDVFAAAFARIQAIA